MNALNIFVLAKLNVFNSILYTSGDYRSVAYISIIESSVRIFLTYILVSLLGIYGLPAAGIISSLIALFLLANLIQEKTGHKKVELFSLGTTYELLIYFIAAILGFYHRSVEIFQENIFNIVIVTFILSCLIVISTVSYTHLTLPTKA